MSVQRCQSETTSAEFSEWQAYLDMEPNMFHREDHYWATIIAWLKRAIVKEPKVVKDDECLIKFVKKEVTVKTKEQQNIEKGKAAKSFFGRLLSVAKQANAPRRPAK